jgi:hypothetical protein
MAAARNEAPATQVEAPATMELTVHYVGSKRTRTSGKRHPLERQVFTGFYI